jgi:hypothetical protein
MRLYCSLLQSVSFITSHKRDEIDFLLSGSQPLVWRIMILQTFRLVATLQIEKNIAAQRLSARKAIKYSSPAMAYYCKDVYIIGNLELFFILLPPKSSVKKLFRVETRFLRWQPALDLECPPFKVPGWLLPP